MSQKSNNEGKIEEFPSQISFMEGFSDSEPEWDVDVGLLSDIPQSGQVVVKEEEDSSRESKSNENEAGNADNIDTDTDTVDTLEDGEEVDMHQDHEVYQLDAEIKACTAKIKDDRMQLEEKGRLVKMIRCFIEVQQGSIRTYKETTESCEKVKQQELASALVQDFIYYSEGLAIGKEVLMS